MYFEDKNSAELLQMILRGTAVLLNVILDPAVQSCCAEVCITLPEVDQPNLAEADFRFDCIFWACLRCTDGWFRRPSPLDASCTLFAPYEVNTHPTNIVSRGISALEFIWYKYDTDAALLHRIGQLGSAAVVTDFGSRRIFCHTDAGPSLQQ